MSKIGHIETIKQIFDTARMNNRLLFIKGGWNIDLAYGEQTRHHDDIDIHYDLADRDFWRGYFNENGFQEKVKDDWYSVFKRGEDITIDFEGVGVAEKTITWSHGGQSNRKDVYEKRTYADFEFAGMKLNVEKYLKEKYREEGNSLREKDNHDLDLIDRINKRLSQ
jgi:lincosamide nucleotidyltransferase A/C/D/E